MLEEDFESYRERITEHTKYSIGSHRELVVFLLWEVLEMLWEIGRLLKQGQTK